MHTFPNKIWLTKAIKQKYSDILLNDWYSKVGSDTNYRIFKHKCELETYLMQLPQNLKYYFTSYRTRNHRLPIETGRWSKIQHNERICNICRKKVGDEFHYLLVCESLGSAKKQFLGRMFTKRPNVIMYESLMKTNNKQLLILISKLIKIINTLVKDNAVET